MEGEMSEPYHLVEQEIPRLRRYARALTRSGDRADDLVQDTLVRALSKAHLWQAGTDIRAWLFTIMHNQHVNTVRRASREQRTVDIDAMSSSLVATTDPTASRQLRELEFALYRLPDEQREVILLVGLEGMSYEMAARVLRVPVGTVRSRLSRARDALRRLMGMNDRPNAQMELRSVAWSSQVTQQPSWRSVRGEDVPIVAEDDSAIPKPLMWDFCEQQADAPGNFRRAVRFRKQKLR
jgi:RNA polymerase sigma-70 factor, ECF subfamily